jgi:hypothetical protein
MTFGMKRTLLVLAVSLVSALVATAPAPAELSLDVAPAKVEVQVSPGTSQPIAVTVRNTGTTPVHIQAFMLDFAMSAGGRYIFSKPGTGRYSMATWATINPREFDVPPNSFQLVRLQANIPSGVSGEYSGIAFFQTRPLRHAGSGMSFSERVSTKVYLYAGNAVRVDGTIDGMAAKDTGFGERFLIGFKNTGTAHVYLKGTVKISRGSEVVQNLALPDQMLVDRGGRRVIEAYSEKLPPGQYTALALVDFGGANYAAGQTSFTVK